MNKSRIFQLAYITLALGALFIVLFLLENRSAQVPPKDQVGQNTFIYIEDIKIPVTIADTPYLRELGLSNTPFLAPNTGKLFIFEESQIYSFWMKDMNYPIDIVWIDENSQIVDISSNISPDTYPKTFSPSKAVKYVLEINANESKDLGIKVGKKIVLPKNF